MIYQVKWSQPVTGERGLYLTSDAEAAEAVCKNREAIGCDTILTAFEED